MSFLGDAGSVLVDVSAGGAPRVTALLPPACALYGDPLLETMFFDPDAAFVEGYGGPLVLFARQKTKRLWYTLFLALVVLVQAKRLGMEGEKVEWAREMAGKCAVALKDAPCY